MKQTLYSLRTDSDQYRITKIVDGEVESSYLSTQYECECPAGHRPSCRHRQMIPEMLARGLCDSMWFWDFDQRRVVDFNGTLKSNIDALNELAIIKEAGPVKDEVWAVGEAQHTEATGKNTILGNVNHDAPNRTVLGTPKAAWRRL